MKPPNDESPVAGAPGEALDSDPTAAGGKPNPDAKIRREADIPQVKICVTCHGQFVPRRRHYRKCKSCAEHFKHELVEHARKRNMDGVVVFRLLEHLRQLRSDDPAAKLWLESLIAGNGDGE